MSQPSKFIHPRSTEYAPSVSTIYYKYEVREIAPNFHGIFSLETIRKGAVIAADGGTVVTSIEDVYPEKKYIVLIDDGLWMGPNDYDSIEPLCYLNHHCEPNVARIGPLTYVAKRDIHPGEEFTIDYAPLTTGFEGWTLECQCGSPVCRKVITSDDWKDPVLAEKLWHEWLPFIQKKISAQDVAKRT